MQDLFHDIRPYTDAEVPMVLNRLLTSTELQQALLQYYAPHIPAWLKPMAIAIIRWRLAAKLRGIDTIDGFQGWLTKLITPLLKRSTTNIEVRGLERLEPGTYLWISNHRDIAMDPLLINYSLYQANWPTSRIAIGDNLLKQADVADVMRLNKSFVVKREISNMRQKLAELKRLSAYIRLSITDNDSVWIAQREGRAKDNIDKTDTAVLKMLALHGRELNEDFTATVQALKLVPVCLQYEWDPCDTLKAKELVALAQDGHYQKALGEDTKSILLGLTGFKGRVVVDFGRPLTLAECANADTVAKAIDAQLQTMCEVLPVHRTALALLQRDFIGYEAFAGAAMYSHEAKLFQQRLTGLTQHVQERLLKTYAAPLLAKTEY